MVLIPKKMGFAGDFQAQMELGEARLARVGCHRKGVARLAAWGLHHQKLRIWHDLTIKDGGFAQKKQKKRFKNDQKWRINQSHNGFGILGWKSGIRQSKLKVTDMSHGEKKRSTIMCPWVSCVECGRPRGGFQCWTQHLANVCGVSGLLVCMVFYSDIIMRSLQNWDLGHLGPGNQTWQWKIPYLRAFPS